MNNFILEEIMQMQSSESELSSSDISTSDSEQDSSMGPNNIIKINNYVETVVCVYSEETFKSHFRISRNVVYFLIGRLEPSKFSPLNIKGKNKVTNEKGMLLTIWYLSNTETFRQISDRYGISLSTTHTVLIRVLKFILSLSIEYIKWPNAAEATSICRDFKNKRGIDNIIGAVDGCHIKIIKPREDSEVYVNRKGYHSLLLQGIVDSNKCFIDVFCGEPGSLHDARLLRKSGIYSKAEDPNFFGDKFVLGDSAYPSLSWIVPPFKDNGTLTADQKLFNFKHSSTRIIVEHTFGLLKGRFRRLQHLDNIDLNTSVMCIMSSCILHNICMKMNDNTLIEMPNLEDNLISDAPCYDALVMKKSRREEVFKKMFEQ